MSFPTLAFYQPDKALGLQNCDDLGADFFDQFLSYSPVTNDAHEYAALPDSTFLETAITNIHSAAASSSSLESEDKKLLDHIDWRCGTWTIPETDLLTQSADGKHFYSELTGRAAISDSELLTLEGISLYSPRVKVPSPSSLPSSLPSSPSPETASLPRKGSHIVRSLSKNLKKAAGSIDRSFRNSNVPYSSPSKVTKKQNTDLWGNLEPLTGETLRFPLSPSQTATIPQTFDHLTSAGKVQRSPTIGISSGFHSDPGKVSALYETPLSSPLLDSEGSRRKHSLRHVSDNAHFPPTPTAENGPNRWSHLPDAEYKSLNGIFNAEGDAPLWWNDAATRIMAQPSQTAFHGNPQRATKTLAMQLHNDVSYRANERAYMPYMSGGFRIQMPGRSPQQSFVMQSLPRQHPGYFPTHQPHFQPRPRHVDASLRHQRNSRLTRKVRRVPSDSESPSPESCPTFHVRKRRTKNKKSSTPRTPAHGGFIDFVNYTPDDSRKILTGVAPSGSSKTKARREKEAMERRRKLSQAAVRAVREAGGDIESLVEQGLLV